MENILVHVNKMDIFGILTMIGGLALFLYGMDTMGDGLVMLSGGRLEKILEKLTGGKGAMELIAEGYDKEQVEFADKFIKDLLTVFYFFKD